MRTFIAVAALAATAACTHPIDTAGSPNFGASVERLQHEQTMPMATSTEAPEGSGAVGALAQERYKTGHTRPLLPTATSTANPQ